MGQCATRHDDDSEFETLFRGVGGRDLDLDGSEKKHKNLPPRPDKFIPCRVHRVIDGDTLDVSYLIDPSSSAQFRVHIRVAGIDTPESRPPLSSLLRDKEKRAAEACKQTVSDLFKCDESDKAMINVASWDKYGGRVVGEIRIRGIHLGNYLITKGLAHPYDGKKKADWLETELDGILGTT